MVAQDILINLIDILKYHITFFENFLTFAEKLLSAIASLLLCSSENRKSPSFIFFVIQY